MPSSTVTYRGDTGSEEMGSEWICIVACMQFIWACNRGISLWVYVWCSPLEEEGRRVHRGRKRDQMRWDWNNIKLNLTDDRQYGSAREESIYWRQSQHLYWRRRLYWGLEGSCLWDQVFHFLGLYSDNKSLFNPYFVAFRSLNSPTMTSII